MLVGHLQSFRQVVSGPKDSKWHSLTTTVDRIIACDCMKTRRLILVEEYNNDQDLQYSKKDCMAFEGDDITRISTLIAD
jgi:hypothetical protein